MSPAPPICPRNPEEAVAWLRTPQAVRRRCGALLAVAERDALPHFRLDPARLDPTARYVVDTIRREHPALDIPPHSRWRHFAAGGRDRWGGLARGLAGISPEERARIRIDLVLTSVLLDAGAGAGWSFREPDSGEIHTRSEGLAVASFHAFASGLFSSRPGAPLRADADTLEELSGGALAAAFKAGDDNPLVGLEGRAALLRRLGAALRARPDLFGPGPPRAGNLYDALVRLAPDGRLSAARMLGVLLDALSDVWPGRIRLGGVNLGDVGRHGSLESDDPAAALIPFHKLSQWLCYSLMEPLTEAGLAVVDPEELTGLPEYRNGGLLIDLGVLVPRESGALTAVHPVESEFVVEWRALTVALLDRLADRVRQQLGLDAWALPMAKVLEGGTWSAGRCAARERRPDGAPPVTVASDGTVF